MRVAWNRLRQFFSSRLWAWPAVTGLIGAIAAVILSSVTVPAEATLARYLWPGDVAAASSMLGFVASATLTVLTMTITLTLVVLQVASSNFSHQLLHDFVSSRAVRGILAVYVGVFAYTVLLQRSFDSTANRPPQLGMTVAMVLIFVAVATFIWYVARVVDMVRVDTVIRNSANRTLRNAAALVRDGQTQISRPEVPPDAQRLTAGLFGYVQSVDTAHAASWAAEHGATVVVDVRPGDSIADGQTLARYWGMSPTEDGTAPKLPDIVYLNRERVSGQDYSLGLRQILDIGTRALSPGINDPTTAEHVIGQAAAVLRRLADEPVRPRVKVADDDGADRVLVWAPVREVPELVSAFVGSLRRYGAAEPDVCVSLLRLLDGVAEVGEPDVRAVAQAERERVVAAAKREIAEPYDLQRVLAAAKPPAEIDDHIPEYGV